MLILAIGAAVAAWIQRRRNLDAGTRHKPDPPSWE